MTEPKTCSTCHWWHQYDGEASATDPWGFCVLHTGLKDERTELVQFGRELLKTRHDFGCIKHEEDKRECREQS